MSRLKTHWLIMPALAASLLAGCASSPDSRFYILSADASQQVANWGENGPKVLIAPINVPEHIKRAEIVFLSEDNRVTLNDYDRWAGRISSNISDTLSQNLTTLLSSNSIYTDDSGFVSRPDIIVRISVNRFGSVNDQLVMLDASWEIEDRRQSRTELGSDSFTYTLQTENVPDVVNAMSATIEKLSEAIAQHLLSL